MKEYNDSLKKIKVNKPIKENKKYSFDNSILKLFGASEKDLKKRKVISDWEKKSYVKIELSLKMYLKELANFINVDILIKILES